MALAYELLVGSREAPGLVMALERGLRTREWGRAFARLRAATAGRLAGVRTYLGVLRD